MSIKIKFIDLMDLHPPISLPQAMNIITVLQKGGSGDLSNMTFSDSISIQYRILVCDHAAHLIAN